MRFPDEAFDYLETNGLLNSVIKYVLNHKNIRSSVWLKPWIAEQVTQAQSDEQVQTACTAILSKVEDKTDYDAIAIEALRYVQRTFRYVSDMTTYKVPEYWQTYKESLQLKQGDCEDGAILLYVLCRCCGIPANRLLILCGDVEGGGHAWLAYKPSNQPWNLAFLDWCYWYDRRDMDKRKIFWIVNNTIYGPDKRYMKIWWCFNERNTYIRFKPTVR